MTNRILNDKGQEVLSVGAPGSIKNLECRFPSLLEDLEELWLELQRKTFAYTSYEFWDAQEDLKKEISELSNLSELEKENLQRIVMGLES